jgi:hypothetical protein
MLEKIISNNLDYHARIECGLCHDKVKVVDIKSDLKKNRHWHQVMYLGTYICPTCYDKVYDKVFEASLVELDDEETFLRSKPV